MGEVFRAHDARLGRDVALKVLPPASVADPVSRARFDREARVLASLNHTAIAQIFGIESHGDAPVIVMEVVEGQTLAERLAKGAVPLATALPIALQICDGLEAAHERGVLHRDLKPANIKTRGDGTVKILDFGLARAFAAESAPADDLPTIVSADTDTGVVMGTPSYMSPEQARGETLDKRTDVWAFGCVLFEMLTGARAFGGHSAAETLANVVHDDPQWDLLPPDTPPRIVELLKRCLQKRVKERLRDIGDVRYEIARAIQHPHERAAAVPVDAGRARRHAAWFGGGAAAATALTLLAIPAFRDDPEIPLSYRTSVQLPAGATLALSRGSAVALSPDGRMLAFTARSSGQTLLYLRHLDRFDAQPLPGTEEAQNPFFSPDGKWIGFFTADKLKRVAIDGGAPLTITDVTNPRGEAWGSGDQIVFTHSNNVGMSRVPAGGGKPEVLTSLREGERSHRWPRFLPGGSMLFSIWNDLGWEPARVALRTVDGAHKVIADGGGYPRYVPDGDAGFLVYARAEGLMGVRFDERSGRLLGQPAPVLDGVITNFSGGAHFDIAPNGTLAFVPGSTLENERRLVWVTLEGQPAAEPALVAQQGMGMAWRLSPDGRRVVRNNTFGQTRDNWIEDLVSRTSTRVPHPQSGFVSTPIWSHDNAWIAFAVDTPTMNVYRQSANAQGVIERLTDSPHMQAPRDVSSDGRYLLYTDFDPVSGADVWVLTLPPGSPGAATVSPASLAPRPLVKTNAIENYPVFSHDGKWVAYQSNDTGRFEVFVRAFPDGDRTFRVSVDGGVSPMWMPDGSAILFRDAGSRLRSAQLADVLKGVPPAARTLLDMRPYENVYAIAPDGKRLLMMTVTDDERAPATINVVLNFLDELKRRLR